MGISQVRKVHKVLFWAKRPHNEINAFSKGENYEGYFVDKVLVWVT